MKIKEGGVMDINKERELFLAHMRSIGSAGFMFELDEDGNFDDMSMAYAWSAWQAAKAQAVPEGFVLVEREKLAMIFETATNALVYHAAPPKHDALSIIQGISRKAMIEAQEPAND